jgi:hypothetical protein
MVGAADCWAEALPVRAPIACEANDSAWQGTGMESSRPAYGCMRPGRGGLEENRMERSEMDGVGYSNVARGDRRTLNVFDHLTIAGHGRHVVLGLSGL